MSESGVQSSGPVIEPDQGAMPAGAGALLRAAREAQGLHIAMLAVSLKVPVKKLEALEADRYDLLPGIVFVRALAASVCRALKIDVEPVMAALPRSDFPKIKTDESGLNTTFDDSVGGAGGNLKSQLSRPLGIAVLLLLVGILVIAFFPLKTVDELVTSGPSGDNTGSMSNSTVVSDIETHTAQGRQMPASAVALTLTNSMDGTVANDGANPAQKSELPSSAPDISSGTAVAAAGGDILSLHAHETSWVEVMDAKGVLQLRKNLIKDEVVPVTGALPLSVVVGRADAVSVVVRGQPFDIASVSKNNVARFEVK